MPIKEPIQEWHVLKVSSYQKDSYACVEVVDAEEEVLACSGLFGLLIVAELFDNIQNGLF